MFFLTPKFLSNILTKINFVSYKRLLVNLVSVLLVILMFILPIVEVESSLLALVIVTLILITPDYRRDLSKIFYQPWCLSVLGLFAFIFIACFWSPGYWEDRYITLINYSKLLVLPLLVIGFRNPLVRCLGLHGFLLAMVVTCIVSLLQIYHLLPITIPGKVFYYHLVTGYMMAFAAYLAAILGVRESNRWIRWFYFILTGLFTYDVLFVNDGRTGFIIYTFVGVLFLYQIRSSRQSFLWSLLSFILFLNLATWQSTVIQKSQVDTLKEFETFQSNKNTSLSFRAQAYEYGMDFIKRHLLFGNGTGSFVYLQLKKNTTDDYVYSEPHNQYLFMSIEGGITGLLLLLIFFGTLLNAFLRLNDMGAIGIALVCSFMMVNLSDSMLYFTNAGYFFIGMAALCLGEIIYPITPQKN